MDSLNARDYLYESFAEPAMQAVPVKMGKGTALCHHGEILQGVFEESCGKETLGLVTLLNPTLQSNVSFFPDSHQAGIQVDPSHKTKALNAAELTIQHLNKPNISGTLRFENSVVEELGLGSSTADVVATIRAISEAAGQSLSREEIAKIAVSAEQASDPIMYENSTVLFAQREGHVIEDLGPLAPSMSLVSFTLGTPISTCHYKAPNYSWEELQQFKPLKGLLRYALKKSDLATLATVSTHSAMINQCHVPKPRFDSILRIVEASSALGLQIAHSGNLVGIIFSPDDCDLVQKVEDCQRRLSILGIENPTFYRRI